MIFEFSSLHRNEWKVQWFAKYSYNLHYFSIFSPLCTYVESAFFIQQTIVYSANLYRSLSHKTKERTVENTLLDLLFSSQFWWKTSIHSPHTAVQWVIWHQKKVDFFVHFYLEYFLKTYVKSLRYIFVIIFYIQRNIFGTILRFKITYLLCMGPKTNTKCSGLSWIVFQYREGSW